MIQATDKDVREFCSLIENKNRNFQYKHCIHIHTQALIIPIKATELVIEVLYAFSLKKTYIMFHKHV